jgi:hypothetical protein
MTPNTRHKESVMMDGRLIEIAVMCRKLRPESVGDVCEAYGIFAHTFGFGGLVESGGTTKNRAPPPSFEPPNCPLKRLPRGEIIGTNPNYGTWNTTFVLPLLFSLILFIRFFSACVACCMLCGERRGHQ